MNGPKKTIDLPFTPEEVASGGPFKNPGLNKVLREHELEKRIEAIGRRVAELEEALFPMKEPSVISRLTADTKRIVALEAESTERSKSIQSIQKLLMDKLK
jgi:regulator of sirC expression with transglutaminase-like and TPR domain